MCSSFLYDNFWWAFNSSCRTTYWHWIKHSNFDSEVVWRWKSIVRKIWCPIVYVQLTYECSFSRINATAEENNAELKNDSIAFLIVSMILSVIQLIAGIICVDCFNQAAISQVSRIRIKYFTSLMRQEIGWYDLEKGKSNFTARLAE